MTTEYDVVVIGAGMGGMCAAAMLVSAGLRTAVVERLPNVGGRCSTRLEKGFKLTTGVDMLSIGGGIEMVFRDIGARYELCPAGMNVWRIGDKDYEMPPRGQLRQVIFLLTGEKENETERIWSAFRRSLSWQEPPDSITLYEWIRQYTRSPAVLNGLDGVVAIFLGIWAHEAPAGEWFRFLRAPRPMQLGFAPEGNLALMQSLSSAIDGRGGKVWTSCEAKHIVVQGGKAVGVVVQSRQEEVELTAKAIISDVGPKETVDMAGSENFEEGYLKLVKQIVMPCPGIVIQVASDRPLIRYPVVNFPENHALVQAFCPTLVCPELAPEGKHLLWVIGLLRSSLPPYRFEEDEKVLLEEARSNLPGFEHAEILETRRLDSNYPYFRSSPGYSLPQKTPIVNLYNVGDGVMPSGLVGTMACEASARIVVEDIKKRLARQVMS